MRFIYSCDIHGDKRKYEKLLEIAQSSAVKNIVIAGDLLPKNADDREKIQKEFIHGWFPEYLKRLEMAQIRLISILGNDDFETVEDEYQKMISQFENVFDVAGKKADIEGCSFIGLSHVLDTPFYRKTRVAIEEGQKMPIQRHKMIMLNDGKTMITEQEWEAYRLEHVPKMRDLLEDLPEITEGNKGIYVFHCPPYGIGLDMCKDGDVVGSKDIVKYIQEKQPYMSLHGHIHESSKMSGNWYANIGETICMNCGQSEFGKKDLHMTLIDTERNLYKRGIVSCERAIEKDTIEK